MSKYIDGLRCAHPKSKHCITYVPTIGLTNETGVLYTDCACGERISAYAVNAPKNSKATHHILPKNIDKQEHVKSYTIRTTNNVSAYQAKRLGQQYGQG